MTTGRALLGWSIAVLLATGCLRLLVPIPPLILLAALVPAACYAALIVLVDRRPQPPAVFLTMLLWGAVVAAPLSATLNGVAQHWLVSATAAAWVSPLLAAPAIEELVKAAGFLALLLIWRNQFTGVLDGIVYGALIGIGFTVTENIDYFMLAALQGGEPGLARSVYLCAVLEGLNHASFAAFTGAGVGYAWTARSMRGRIGAPLTGLSAAILQHALWNAVAAQRINSILCNPTIPSGPCTSAPPATGLFIEVPLVIVACIGPGAVIVSVFAVAAHRRRVTKVGGCH